ncbi:hypothetical protein MPTK1_7g04920 [Marchantia polymorpha subsp. ruderalis]|uniref:Uncharacterized protein n=2 Tax=Marchantia polymorpha TaxID=3197 RepID=A0AAF6BW90_MARPO|nr:hypothetical protein MARPO_0062s0034 [Marchantia polymorpha]BBN16274.1 hypothetical protein Mp_7g04920 [Marchantia polymorpha subsp. ruderalis]|eukprot:PTQ36608.1 hypothetical protein MARPO_0062s0034 [Marchantia polymorpha]
MHTKGTTNPPSFGPTREPRDAPRQRQRHRRPLQLTSREGEHLRSRAAEFRVWSKAGGAASKRRRRRRRRVACRGIGFAERIPTRPGKHYVCSLGPIHPDRF